MHAQIERSNPSLEDALDDFLEGLRCLLDRIVQAIIRLWSEITSALSAAAEDSNPPEEATGDEGETAAMDETREYRQFMVMPTNSPMRYVFADEARVVEDERLEFLLVDETPGRWGLFGRGRARAETRRVIAGFARGEWAYFSEEHHDYGIV